LTAFADVLGAAPDADVVSRWIDVYLRISVAIERN